MAFLVAGLKLLRICCSVLRFVLVSSLLCDLSMASTTPQSRITKSFAQALTNSCSIPNSHLPKPCLKGEQLSIRISEDEVLAEILDCQKVLNGRFTLPKGSSPVCMLDLKERISKFWQTKGLWSMAPLGKGYFEFVLLGISRRASFVHLLGLLTSILTRCNKQLLKHGFAFMVFLENIGAKKHCLK